MRGCLAALGLLCVQAWDLHSALNSHKDHKKEVQAQLVDVGKIDEKYSSVDGKSYYEAQLFCKEKHKRLCSSKEYCPDDKLKFPVAGLMEGDIWAAVEDSANDWVNVGRKHPERVCSLHSSSMHHKPEWGKLRQQGSMGQMVLCCPLNDARNVQKNRLSVKEMAVYKQIAYWERPKLDKAELNKLFPAADGKYLLFNIDNGGFNNIRLGLEVVTLVALLTGRWVVAKVNGRTLVLPPPIGWYLIDWGPNGNKQNAKGIREFTMDGGVSEIYDFFDKAGYKNMLGDRVITTAEFIKREREGMVVVAYELQAIPAHLTPISVCGGVNADGDRWVFDNGLWVNWDPTGHMLQWPSQAKVDGRYGAGGLPRELLSGRRKVEYTVAQQAAKMLVFPGGMEWPQRQDKRFSVHNMAVIENGNYRFLGYFASFAAYSEPAMFKAVKQAFRDGVHYVPQVYRIAAKVVARLGLFKYSSMHVRRNELQYAFVKIGATAMMDRVGKLFDAKETLVVEYIATDELDEHFFDVMRERGHALYQWKDFFTDKGGNVLKGVTIPESLVGQVEQVICACGRVFVGTSHSTFSGFIPRIRGYIDAPDKAVYHATETHSKPTSKEEYHKKPRSGGDFYDEWWELWEGLD